MFRDVRLLSGWNAMGIITPDGVVQTQRKCVELTDIEVREYGYSNALWKLCPQGWKDCDKDRGRVVCRDIQKIQPYQIAAI